MRHVYEGKTKSVFELENGNMRVFRDGEQVNPLELADIVTGM